MGSCCSVWCLVCLACILRPDSPWPWYFCFNGNVFPEWEFRFVLCNLCNMDRTKIIRQQPNCTREMRSHRRCFSNFGRRKNEAVLAARVCVCVKFCGEQRANDEQNGMTTYRIYEYTRTYRLTHHITYQMDISVLCGTAQSVWNMCTPYTHAQRQYRHTDSRQLLQRHDRNHLCTRSCMFGNDTNRLFSWQTNFSRATDVCTTVYNQ